MRELAGGDAGIDALNSRDRQLVLAPVARIHRHHIRESVRRCSDAPQHGHQVLDVTRLVASLLPP